VTTPTTIDDDVRLSPLASRLSPLDGFFDHPHSPRIHDDDDDDDDDPYTPPTRDAARWRIASPRTRKKRRARTHAGRPIAGRATDATKPYPKSRAY